MASLTSELVYQGKRLYGVYLQQGDLHAYIAFRRPGDLFKGANKGQPKSISDAMRDEKAAWAIDEHHLSEARRRGVKLIGFWIRKPLDWLFVAPIEHFLDPECYFARNYAGRGGSVQRYLPLRFFTERSRGLPF